MATVTPSTCGSPLGRVVVVSVANAAPMSVTFDGIALQNMGVCTRMVVNQSVIAQFQNTFDSFIYITPFGDKPGTIALSFIVNQKCDETQSTLNAIDFYVQRRLRPSYLTNVGGFLTFSQTAPITVAINSLTLRGFVTGLEVEGTTNDSAIVSATLLMTGWPV